MRLENITEDALTEARMVWRKSGNKVVRAVRCTAGRRKGRVVSTASQCSAPINLKARITLKKNKAKFGKRMSRKAQRAKKFNPVSRRLRALNKSTGKRR
jgi:hypothetical protein